MAKSEIATIINGKELFAVTCDGCGQVLYLEDADGTLFNVEAQELSYREYRDMNLWVPAHHPEMVFCNDCAVTRCECAHCNTVIEQDEFTVDNEGDCYCQRCADQHLHYCEHCEGYVFSDLTEVYVTDRGDVEYWCDDCVGDYAFTCAECGDTYAERLSNYVDGYGDVCCGCADDDELFTRCDECGTLIRTADANYEEDDDGDTTGVYCYSCMRHRDPDRREVPGYHNDNTPWTLEEVDRLKHLLMGVELEMERGGTIYKNALAISEALGISHKEKKCRIERDGSLDNGFEIITMPHTLKFYQKELKLEEGFAEAVKRNYRSHDGGNCGAHVHMDRMHFRDSMFDPERAMIIIVQNNRDWLQKFSRRESDHMGYCRFFNNDRKFTPDDFKAGEGGDTTRQQSAEQLLDRMRDYYVGHGSALNFSGHATIEVRFFRGTLKPNTLRANMEFVEMMGYAMKHFSDVQLCNVDLHWFKRFAKRKGYESFLSYIEERGIIA